MRPWTAHRLAASAGAILAALFATWLVSADTVASRFVGIAVFAAVALDIATTIWRRRSLDVRATATGTFDVDDGVPILLSWSGADPDASDDTIVVAPTVPYLVDRRHPSRGELRMVAFFERGGYDHVELQVMIRSFLGLYAEYATLRRDADFVVGPRIEPAQIDEPFPDPERELVSVREYQRGDPKGLVHWRSTARCQTLMVKAEEPQLPGPHASAGALTVVVSWLVEGDPESERAHGRARTYAERGLELGLAVTLISATRDDGPAARRVHNREDILRLLALAHPTATPLELPIGSHGVVVHPGGDR